MKNKIMPFFIAVFFILSLAGCGTVTNGTPGSSGTSETVSPDASSPAVQASAEPVSSIAAKYDEQDTNASWNVNSATNIELEGLEAAISGGGATAENGVVTITTGGVYVLTGDYTGSIVIAATSSDDVQLVLNGVNISATKNAAIYCSGADKMILTLTEGSKNTVTDASDFVYADTAAEEPDAAIFSKVDLSINGTGSLTVNAGFKNGIGTKDDLIIASGTLNIHAANDGLRGRDSVTVLDGSITINAGSDGIQSNNDEDSTKGWVLLEGGTLQITSASDAIQAETQLEILGGAYTLTTGGGYKANVSDTAESYKGIKAGTNIIVSGGSFIIDSADDSVHANGNIAVSGGIFTLYSGDDGIHADGDLTVSGSPEITVLSSYEGMEAKTMTLAGGIINVNATDDGINVAGGNNEGTGGQFGRDKFSATSSDQWLKITGGTITVIAGRDGIDINGSGEMNGGTVDVTAATLGEGNTVDSDGGFNRTGGTLTETGGNGMGGMGGQQPGGGQGGRGGMGGQRSGG